MDELIEENQKKSEKRAFYVGLATVVAIVFILGLTIFFIRGCSSVSQNIEEVKQNEVQPVTSQIAATPVATQGSVAGEKTEPTPTPTTQGKTYTVESGDTLYEIGKKFKVDWRKIAQTNGIENAAALKVGKEIIIPSE